MRVGSLTAVDEGAIALIDLAVIVYSPLDTIRRTFDALGVRVVAFDAASDRGPDLAWLAAMDPLRDLGAVAPGRLPANAPLPADAPPPHPLTGLIPIEGLVTLLRLDVDRAIASEPAGTTDESPTLRAARAALARLLAGWTPMPLPATQLVRDARNRPPRLIAFRHGSDVYLGFRGSATPEDWKRNFTCWPARRRPLRHQGFETVWQEVRPHLTNWLAGETRALGRRPTLHIGGHSLAGAVATLAAIDLAAVGYPVARVATIGSARVGGRDLRAQYRSTPAAQDATGTARTLADVTIRWVHGSDVVTILPPPPFAVHVVEASHLTADDRLDVHEFVGNGLFDTAPLIALLMGSDKVPNVGYSAGLATPSSSPGRIGLVRAASTQIATWIAMAFPSLPWLRVLPFVPALAAQIHVSGAQHKSARYWAFMPPTALRRSWAAVQAPRTTVVHKATLRVER